MTDGREQKRVAAFIERFRSTAGRAVTLAAPVGRAGHTSMTYLA